MVHMVNMGQMGGYGAYCEYDKKVDMGRMVDKGHMVDMGHMVDIWHVVNMGQNTGYGAYGEYGYGADAVEMPDAPAPATPSTTPVDGDDFKAKEKQLVAKAYEVRDLPDSPPKEEAKTGLIDAAKKRGCVEMGLSQRETPESWQRFSAPGLFELRHHLKGGSVSSHAMS